LSRTKFSEGDRQSGTGGVQYIEKEVFVSRREWDLKWVRPGLNHGMEIGEDRLSKSAAGKRKKRRRGASQKL